MDTLLLLSVEREYKDLHYYTGSLAVLAQGPEKPL
jgi:hypothetical protein